MDQETRTVTELMAQLVRFYDYLCGLEIEKLDWQARPAEEEWSLTELMCHLRDVEIEVHQERLRAVTAQENAFLVGQDTDHWAIERDYRVQDGPAARLAFLAAREETLTLLAGLETQAWQRSGRHSFLGKTTILELMGMAVAHEQEHWDQIKALVTSSADLST